MYIRLRPVIGILIGDHCMLGSKEVPWAHYCFWYMLTLCHHKYVADGVLLQYADDTAFVCSGTSLLAAAAEETNQQLQLL